MILSSYHAVSHVRCLKVSVSAPPFRRQAAEVDVCQLVKILRLLLSRVFRGCFSLCKLSYTELKAEQKSF